MTLTNNSDKQTAEAGCSNVLLTNSGVSQRQGEGRISRAGAIVKLQLLNLSYDQYHIHTSSNIALALLRNIKYTPVRTRRSVAFARRVRNQLSILNSYNRATFEARGKYPYSRALILLLVRYVQLEFDVLYHPENYSAKYEEEVEEKVRFFLHLMLDGVVKKYKRENQVCTATECALRVLNQVSSEYKVEGRFVWSLINKLANKLGIAETISEIRQNGILIPQNNPVYERLSCDNIEDISDCESDDANEIPSSPDRSCDSPIETLRTAPTLSPEPPYLDSGQGVSFFHRNNEFGDHDFGDAGNDSDNDDCVISEVQVQRLFEPKYEVQDINSDDGDDHLDLIAEPVNRKSVQILSNQSNFDDVAIKSTNESKACGDLKLNRITDNYSDNSSLTVFGNTSGYKSSEYGQNSIPVIEIPDDDEDDDVIEVIDVPRPIPITFNSIFAVQQAQVPQEPHNEIKQILPDSDDDDDYNNEDQILEKFNEEVKKNYPRTTSDNQVNEISSTTGKELTYAEPFSSINMPINNNFFKTSAGSSENNPSLQSYKKMNNTPEQSTSQVRAETVNEKPNIEDDDNSSLSWKENMMRVCHGIDVSLCFPEYIQDKIEENYPNITSPIPGPSASQESDKASDSKTASFENMMCKQIEDTAKNFFFKQLPADEQTKEHIKKASTADNTAIASTSKGNTTIHIRKGKASLKSNTSESKQDDNQNPIICEGNIISSFEVSLRDIEMTKLLSNIKNFCFQTAVCSETLLHDNFKLKSTNTTLKKKSRTPVTQDSITNGESQFHCSKDERINTETDTSGEGSRTLTAANSNASKILYESNTTVKEPLLISNLEEEIASKDVVLEVNQKTHVTEEKIPQETNNERPTSQDIRQIAVCSETLSYDSFKLESSNTTLNKRSSTPVIENFVTNGETQFHCSKDGSITTETDTPGEGSHTPAATNDNAPKTLSKNYITVKEPLLISNLEEEIALKDVNLEVSQKTHVIEERIPQETDNERPISQDIRQTAACSETLSYDSFKLKSTNTTLKKKSRKPVIENFVTNEENQFHCSKNESNITETDTPGEGSHTLTATNDNASKILSENHTTVKEPLLISNLKEEITSKDAVLEVSQKSHVTEEKIPQKTDNERPTSQDNRQTAVCSETMSYDSFNLKSTNTTLNKKSSTPVIEDFITNGESQFHCLKNESINSEIDPPGEEIHTLIATDDNASKILSENNTPLKEPLLISNLEEEMASKDVVEVSQKSYVTKERIPQKTDNERPTLQDIRQTVVYSETLSYDSFNLKSTNTTLNKNCSTPVIEDSITNGESQFHCSKNESITRETDTPGEGSHTLTATNDNASKLLSENNTLVKEPLLIPNLKEEIASKDVVVEVSQKSHVTEERIPQKTDNERPTSQDNRQTAVCSETMLYDNFNLKSTNTTLNEKSRTPVIEDFVTNEESQFHRSKNESFITETDIPGEGSHILSVTNNNAPKILSENHNTVKEPLLISNLKEEITSKDAVLEVNQKTHVTEERIPQETDNERPTTQHIRQSAACSETLYDDNFKLKSTNTTSKKNSSTSVFEDSVTKREIRFHSVENKNITTETSDEESHTLTATNVNASEILSENNTTVKESLLISNLEEEIASKDVVLEETDIEGPTSQDIGPDTSTSTPQIEEDKTTYPASLTKADKNPSKDQFKFETSAVKPGENADLKIEDCKYPVSNKDTKIDNSVITGNHDVVSNDKTPCDLEKHAEIAPMSDYKYPSFNEETKVDNSLTTEDYDVVFNDKTPYNLEKPVEIASISEIIQKDLPPVGNDKQTSYEIQTNPIDDSVAESESNQNEACKESGIDDNVRVIFTSIKSESETGLTPSKKLNELVEEITEKTSFETAAISDSQINPMPIKSEQSTSVSVTSDTNNKKAECEGEFVEIVIPSDETDSETKLPTCKFPNHQNTDTIANELEEVLAYSDSHTNAQNIMEDQSRTKESQCLYALSTELEEVLVRSQESFCDDENSSEHDKKSEKLRNTKIPICEERREEHQQCEPNPECESRGEPKKLEETDENEDNSTIPYLQSLSSDCNIDLLDTDKNKETYETSLVNSVEIENGSDIQKGLPSENREICSNTIEESLISNEFVSSLPKTNPMESSKDDDDIEDNSKLESSSLGNKDFPKSDHTEDKNNNAPDESEPCQDNATTPLAAGDIEEIFLILPNEEEVENKECESVEDNGDEDIFFILDTSGEGDIGEGVQFKEDDLIHLNFVIEEDENNPEESPENIKKNETATIEDKPDDVTHSLLMEDIRYDGADIPTLDEEVYLSYCEDQSDSHEVTGTNDKEDIRGGEGHRQQAEETEGFENRSNIEDMHEVQYQETITVTNLLENEVIHEIQSPEVITLSNHEEVTHEATCEFQIHVEEDETERNELLLNTHEANEINDAAFNIDTDHKECNTLQITNFDDAETDKPNEIESNAIEAEPDLENEDDQNHSDQSHEDIGQKLRENETDESNNLNATKQVEIEWKSDKGNMHSEALVDEGKNSYDDDLQINPNASSCEITSNNVEPSDELPIAEVSLEENGNCEQVTQSEIVNHSITPSHEMQTFSTTEAVSFRQLEPENAYQSIVITPENKANLFNSNGEDPDMPSQELNFASDEITKDVTTLHYGENIDTLVNDPIKNSSQETDKNAAEEEVHLDQPLKEVNVHEVNIIPHDINASCVDLQSEYNDQAVSGLKCLTSEEVQCFVKAEITDLTDKCKVLYSSVVGRHDSLEPMQIAAITVESEDFHQSFNVPLRNIEKSNEKKTFLSSTHTQHQENMEDPYENLEILATAAAAQKSLRVENNAAKYKRSRIKMAAVQKSGAPGSMVNFKPNEVRETVTKQPAVYATAPTESDFSAMSEDSSDSFGGKLIIAEEEQSAINEAIFDEDTVEENIFFIRTKVDIENAEIQISIKDSEIYEGVFDETNNLEAGDIEEHKTSKTSKAKKFKGKSLPKKSGKKVRSPSTNKLQINGRAKAETTPKSRKSVKKVSKTINQIETKDDSEIDDIPLKSRIALNFKTFFNKTANKDLKQKKNINKKPPVKSSKKKPVDKFADLRSEIIKRRAAQMNKIDQKESKETSNIVEPGNESAEFEIEPPTTQISQSIEHHSPDDHRIIMGKSPMLTHDGEIVKVDVLSSLEHTPEITVEEVSKIEENELVNSADTTRIEQESVANDNIVRHPIRTKAELKSYDKKNIAKDVISEEIQDKFKLRSYVKLVRNPCMQKMIEEQYKPSSLELTSPQKITLGRKSYKNLLQARRLLHRTNALQTHAKMNNGPLKGIQKAEQNNASFNQQNGESKSSAENVANTQKNLKTIDQEAADSVSSVRKLFAGHKVTNEIIIEISDQSKVKPPEITTATKSENNRQPQNITGNSNSEKVLPKYRKATRSLSIEMSKVSSVETMTQGSKSRSSNSEPRDTNSIREKSKYRKTSRSVSVDVKSSSLPNLTDHIEVVKITKCNRMNSDSNLVRSQVNSSIHGKRKEFKSNKKNSDDVLATIQPLIKRQTRELRSRSIDDNCPSIISKIQRNITKEDHLNLKKTVSKLSAIGTTLEEIPVRSPPSKKQMRNIQPIKQKENSFTEVKKFPKEVPARTEKTKIDNSEKLKPRHQEFKVRGKTKIDRIPEPATKYRARRLNMASLGKNGTNNLNKQIKQNVVNGKVIKPNLDQKEDSTTLKRKPPSKESLFVDESNIENDDSNDDAEAKKIKFMEDTLALTAKKDLGKQKSVQKVLRNRTKMSLKPATFILKNKKGNQKLIDVKNNSKSTKEDNKDGEKYKVQDINDVKLTLPTEIVKNINETVIATKIDVTESSKDDNICVTETMSETKKKESEDLNEAASMKQLETHQDDTAQKHPDVKEIAEKNTEVIISSDTLKSDVEENPKDTCVEMGEDIKEIEVKDKEIETMSQDVQQIQDMACQTTNPQEVIKPNNVTIDEPLMEDVEMKEGRGNKTKGSESTLCSVQNLKGALEAKMVPKSRKEKLLGRDNLLKTVESENKSVIITPITDNVNSENNITQTETTSTEMPNQLMSEESENLSDNLKESLDISCNSSKELLDESMTKDISIVDPIIETKDEMSEVTDENMTKDTSTIDSTVETKDEISKNEESNGNNLPIPKVHKVDTSLSMEEESNSAVVVDSLPKLPTVENNEQKPPELESKSITISSNIEKIENQENCNKSTPSVLVKEIPENIGSVTSNQQIVLNVPKPYDRKSIIKKTLISTEQLPPKGLTIQHLPKKKRVTFNIADIIFDANSDSVQPKGEVDSSTGTNYKRNSISSKVEEVLVKKQENQSNKETTNTKPIVEDLGANKIPIISLPPPKVLNFEQRPRDLNMSTEMFPDKNKIKRKLFHDSETDVKKQKTEDLPKIEIEKLKMSVKSKLERAEMSMMNKEPIVTSPTKRKDTRKNIDDIINCLRNNLDSKDVKDLEEKGENKALKPSDTDERVEVTVVEIIDDGKRNRSVKDLKTLALETRKRCFFQPWQDTKSSNIKLEENKTFDRTINDKSPTVQNVDKNKLEDIEDKTPDKIEQVEANSSKDIQSNENKTPAISISNDSLEEPQVLSAEDSDPPNEAKMDTSISTTNSDDASPVKKEEVMKDKVEDMLTEEVSRSFAENNFSTSTPLKLIQREYSLISEDSVEEKRNSDSLEKTDVSYTSLESDVKDTSDNSISENAMQDALVNKDETSCIDDSNLATITPTEELIMKEVSNNSTIEKVANSPNNTALDSTVKSRNPLDLEATRINSTTSNSDLLLILEDQPSEKLATKDADDIETDFSTSAPDNSIVKAGDTKMTLETSNSLTENTANRTLICTTEDTQTPLVVDVPVQQKDENFILENSNPMFEDSSKMQEEMLLNFNSDQFPEVTPNAVGDEYNASSTSLDKRNDLIDPSLNLKTNDGCLISCSGNNRVTSDIIVSAASRMADLVPTNLSWSNVGLSEPFLLKDNFEQQAIVQGDEKIFSNPTKNDASEHASTSKLNVSEKLDVKPAVSHLRVKDEFLLTFDGVKDEGLIDNMLRTSARSPTVRDSDLITMTTQMPSFVNDQVQNTSASGLNSSVTFANTLALNPENPNPILGKDFDTIDEDDTPITEKLKANGGVMQIGSGTISDHNYSMGGPLLGGKCEPSDLPAKQLRQERDQRSSTEDLDNSPIESDSIFPFSEPVCISLIENNLTQETNRSLNHSPVDTNYQLSEQDSQLSFPFIQESSQQLQDNQITSALIQNLKQECESDQDSNITSLIEDYDQLIRINPMSIEKMISFQKLMHSNSQKFDETCIPDQNNFLTNFDLEDMESISLTSDNSKTSEISPDKDIKAAKEVKQELPTEKVTVKFNEHEFASMDSIKDIIYPKSPQINKDDMIRSSIRHISPKQRRKSIERAGSRSPRKNKKHKENETMLSNFSSAMKAKAMADIERKKSEIKAKEVNIGYPIRQNKKTPVFAPIKNVSPSQDKYSPLQINSNPSSPIIKLMEESSMTPKKNIASVNAEITVKVENNNKGKVEVVKKPEQIQEKPKETIREIVQDMVQDGVLDDFLINLIKKRPSTDPPKPPPKKMDSPSTPSHTTNTDTLINSMDFYDKYDTIKGRKRRQPPDRLIDKLTMEMLVKDNKNQPKQSYKDQNKPKQYFRDQSKAKRAKFDEGSSSDEPSKFDKRLKRDDHELGFKRYADYSDDDFLNKSKRPRTQAEIDRIFDALKKDEDNKLLQKKANPIPVDDPQCRPSSTLLNSNPRRPSTSASYYYDPKRYIPPPNRNDMRTYQGKLGGSSQSCSSSNNVILNTHYQQRNPYRQYQNPPNPRDRCNSSMRSSVDNSGRRTSSGSRGQPFPPLSNIRVGNPRAKDDLDWMNKVSPFIKQPPVTFGTETKQ